jgi:hypothetical protein
MKKKKRDRKKGERIFSNAAGLFRLNQKTNVESKNNCERPETEIKAYGGSVRQYKPNFCQQEKKNPTFFVVESSMILTLKNCQEFWNQK